MTSSMYGGAGVGTVCAQTLDIAHMCRVQCCFCLLSLSVSKYISLYCTYIYTVLYVYMHLSGVCECTDLPPSASPHPLHYVLSKTRVTSYDKGENVIQKLKGVATGMKELKLVNLHTRTRTHTHTHTHTHRHRHTHVRTLHPVYIIVLS